MLTKNTVKYIQSLTQKKFRDLHGEFIAETPKVVEDMLHSRALKCSRLFAIKEWAARHRDLMALAAESYIISSRELLRISNLKTPHQVLSVFQIPDYKDLTGLQDKISIILDEIQDPGNMGAIIRIADWFGIENIICSHHCAHHYTPKVVQASMGSITRVQVHYTHLEKFLDESKLPLYAATLDGLPIQQLGKIQEGLLLIGNESRGISDALIQRADTRISIPKYGGAESLNASVATGILLAYMKQ